MLPVDVTFDTGEETERGRKHRTKLKIIIVSFKIFADDTNVFVSASNLKTLEALMNSELEKVKEWCDVNKLSINM